MLFYIPDKSLHGIKANFQYFRIKISFQATNWEKGKNKIFLDDPIVEELQLSHELTLVPVLSIQGDELVYFSRV